MITSSLLIFDHRLRTLKIVANAFLEDGSHEKVYTRAVDSIDAIAHTLAKSVELSMLPTADFEPEPAHSNIHPDEFTRAVERAQDYIHAGDVFQVVLSQRFESDFSGDPLDFYRCLRFVNPSPYMFCLKFGAEFAFVGSSPEMHVRLTGDAVRDSPACWHAPARDYFCAGPEERGRTSRRSQGTRRAHHAGRSRA